MGNELFWAVMLLVNFIAIIAAYRLWGRIGLFIWVPAAVIIANIQVTKTVELFGITATLGNIVYASSFLVTDILSENYGKKDARRAVGIGFFSLILFTLLMNLALFFEPAPGDFAHESMNTIFGFLPRIVAASLAAYGVSQLHDVFAYHRWKQKFPGKRFIWLRNNMSTMVSQLIDSLIFTSIAFWGVFPQAVLLEIFITTYLLKWIVALLDTPFVYLARLLYDRKRIPELQ
ncbi:MAG: queuosine precursor transporter [Spirochaetaceae bacterium]